MAGRRRYSELICTALLFLLMGANVCSSEVKISRIDDKGRFATIQLTDRITPADATSFTQVTALLRPNFDVVEVELDSAGGDVFAAMQIGTIIRKDWLWTAVPDEPPAKGCLSACVLVLAAGAVRII